MAKHKGLAFLIEFYNVKHLQSMDETIDDLLIICQQNGGALARTNLHINDVTENW